MLTKSKALQILDLALLALAFAVALSPSLLDFFKPWPKAMAVVSVTLAAVSRGVVLLTAAKGVAQRFGILPKPEEPVK